MFRTSAHATDVHTVQFAAIVSLLPFFGSIVMFKAAYVTER